ncbi:MAG TPA: DUF1059 domain-containing protein [Dehalococcoidia bacterium]
MKTMTCKQLAGACDQEFHAATFEEMGELSRRHAMQMAGSRDKGHIEKMDEMKGLMNQPGAVEEWFKKMREEFDALPEDD